MSNKRKFVRIGGAVMNYCMVAKVMRRIRRKAFLLITLGMILCLGTMALGAQREQTQRVYYEAVFIHSGDTLWQIAKEYKADNEKIEHMISEIMKINGMRSENIISGESLIVPIKK